MALKKFKNPSDGIMNKEWFSEELMTNLKTYITFKRMLVFWVLSYQMGIYWALIFFGLFAAAKLLWKAMDIMFLNRIGFGAFCSVSLLAIGCLIKLG